MLYDNFFAPVRTAAAHSQAGVDPQVSVCCPSRVSLLRAQYAHNHNITFVSAPWGGWDVFNQQGYVGQTLPDFLQQAGYNTYYTGKFMNDHTEKNCESLPVSGYVGGPRTETYVLTRRTRPTSSSTRTRTTIGT